MFTGNQMPTPIKPVEGLVAKGRERNFRMQPQKKLPSRQQHGRKGKCPNKAQPVSPPSINLISDPPTFLTSMSVPAPSALHSQNSARKQLRMRHPPKFRWRVYTPTAWTFQTNFQEIKQLAHDKKPCAMASIETWLTSKYRDSKVVIPGFSLIRTDSSRLRSGGVTIYLSNVLPLRFIYFDFSAQPMADTLWLQLPLRH